MYVAGDILSYKSINIEIQKNIFVVFLLFAAGCIARGLKPQDNERLNGRWRVSRCKAFFACHDVSERCFA